MVAGIDETLLIKPDIQKEILHNDLPKQLIVVWTQRV